MSDEYDLIILGSGPGGYVAAIRASQLGLKCAIVERERLGGICLNWGCIPTKALLRSSEIHHFASNAASYGVSVPASAVDLPAVVARSRKIADQLNTGVTGLMKKHRIRVFQGVGRISGPGRLSVDIDGTTTELQAPHIIVATGARARELPFATSDGDRVWTYRHAMTPKEKPTKLLVIGSGAIGCEFASFYADIGVDVTIVETLDRILPVEDEEISAFVAKAFAKQGMKCIVKASVENLVVQNGRDVTATIKTSDGKAEVMTFSHCIIAVGIVPNTDAIGLEAAGVALERGRPTVDPYGATNVKGIWAIGDIVGAPWLAHKAMHEGVIAAEAIAAAIGKHDAPLQTNHTSNIAGCTYSRPQVASVGLTEAKARSLGLDVKVGRFPAIGNGKAIALGEVDGFVKTVFDAKTGELLGAHMVGAEVTELIQGFVIARQLEATEADLIGTIFPHPTLSEMMHEGVLAAFDRPLHI
ncbi:MAG: dihydrolipoyl dehydrogenase [Janthinobacterium lividum]